MEIMNHNTANIFVCTKYNYTRGSVIHGLKTVIWNKGAQQYLSLYSLYFSGILSKLLLKMVRHRQC